MEPQNNARGVKDCLACMALCKEVACDSQGHLVSQETKEEIESMRNTQSDPTSETSFQVPPDLDNRGHCSSELEEEPLLNRDGTFLPDSEDAPSSERQQYTSCCSQVRNAVTVSALFVFSSGLYFNARKKLCSCSKKLCSCSKRC